MVKIHYRRRGWPQLKKILQEDLEEIATVCGGVFDMAFVTDLPEEVTCQNCLRKPKEG